MSRFLDDAFVERDAEAARDFYDQWAATYETDIVAQGYAAPARCAGALVAQITDFTVPVLDFGCGTGLAGQALTDAGFTHIDGVDIAPAMVEQARSKEIYRTLSVIRPDAAPKGRYELIIAVGVIGLGAAPSSTIDVLMHALPKGGKLVFTFNDHALADPMQTGRLNEWVDCGAAGVLFAEYGPHLPEIDVKSTVYVIEKY